MKRVLKLFVLMGFQSLLWSQHTFSIVAIDSLTGEIGSAGATCLDTVLLKGGVGALLISDIVPGIGAIHTQAWWNPENQKAARKRMELGETPGKIIRWLVENDDSTDNHSISERQYGIVCVVNGKLLSAAFTGEENMPEASHITGPGYSIQGNILLGRAVLEDMELAFLSAKGSLADRLMAAMKGAKRPGADSRCLAAGVSSLSAFLRVANPGDTRSDYGQLALDINIPAVSPGTDPIDALQKAYDIRKNH
ncbi:DUF1028 domain-containing protein [Robiginitalea sp. SC105]|uniref:DUF1028 domain-containing protein n=1 Tax=Robiginitalea sp. SC105 TaxID=2762332 RepID=UPI0016399D01|nr:DUF1028 domain-containing protein [Robiginitalea sp. SC105]MBC2839827.1 DUF1028 domain-containing protein [Robiginitalea sp. SC105]